MPGIALAKKNVWLQPANMRQSIDRYRQCTTPAIVDTDILELWKQKQHTGSNETLNVTGKSGSIVFAAAEDQPIIVRHSEIVDDKPCVMNAESAVDHLPRTRLRSDHEIIDRHDLAGHPRFQFAQVAIAGKKKVTK